MLKLFTLFALLLGLSSVSAQTLITTSGTLEFTIDHLEGETYTIFQDDGLFYKLKFDWSVYNPSDIQRILTASVTGSQSDSQLDTLQVIDINPLSLRPVSKAGPPSIKALIFHLERVYLHFTGFSTYLSMGWIRNSWSR